MDVSSSGLCDINVLVNQSAWWLVDSVHALGSGLMSFGLHEVIVAYAYYDHKLQWLLWWHDLSHAAQCLANITCI